MTLLTIWALLTGRRKRRADALWAEQERFFAETLHLADAYDNAILRAVTRADFDRSHQGMRRLLDQAEADHLARVAEIERKYPE